MLANFLITFFTVLAQHSLAARFGVYLGAGGESVSIGQLTFLNDAKKVRALEDAGWNMTYLFGGDQARTQKARAQNLGLNAQAFSVENTRSTFEKLRRQIEAGEIKRGDQLYIHIDSHGYNDPNYKFAAANGSIDIDDLRQFQKIASSKGIKTAIVGLTCYDGQLQQLADENTCVITGGREDGVNTSLPVGIYSSELTRASGKSLEEVYLQFRKSSTEYDQPAISSPVGQRLQSEMRFLRNYISLTEFLLNDQAGALNKCIDQGLLPDFAAIQSLGPSIQKSFIASLLDNVMSRWNSWSLSDGTLASNVDALVKLRDARLRINPSESRVCFPLVEGESSAQCFDNPANYVIAYLTFAAKTATLMQLNESGDAEELKALEETIARYEQFVGSEKFVSAARASGFGRLPMGSEMLEAINAQKKQLPDTRDGQSRIEFSDPAALFNENFKLLQAHVRGSGSDGQQGATLQQFGLRLHLEERLRMNIVRTEREIYSHLYSEYSKTDKIKNPCRDFIF